MVTYNGANVLLQTIIYYLLRRLQTAFYEQFIYLQLIKYTCYLACLGRLH